MVRRFLNCLLVYGWLLPMVAAILLAATALSAPEPLQRDTQTKALIQTQLDMKGVTLTLGSLIVSDSAGIRVWDLGSTNGTKLGDTGDKLAFLGATPIVRPSSTTDLRQALINLGLYTTGGASPLNLNGGAFTAAAITGTTGTFTSTMGITGNTTIGGTLGVTGAITGPSLSLSGNALVGGTLGVTGVSTLAAVSATSGTFSLTLGVTGNTTLGGTLGVTGATSGSSFSYSGNGTVGGTFGATGNSTFGGTLGITGALSGSSFSFIGNGSVGGTLGVNSNATVGGTFGVTGASTLAAMSATTGTFSSTLGVTGAASFSSTVRGTVQDKGGAVYHVKAYGVVGDGTTNDTAAIQSLLTAVKAAGGGIVYFDAGTFVMNTSATLASSTGGITIRGAGKGATIIKSTVAVGTPANSDPIIFLFSGSTSVTLEDITFDGNNIVTTQPNCSLVATIQTPLQVYNCEFINFKRNAVAIQSTTLEVTGSRFNRTTTEGSYINLAIIVYSNLSRSGPILIESNEFAGAGIEVDADDSKFTNNDINGFGYGAGIALDFGASNGVVSGNTITGGTGPDANGFYCKGIEVYGTPMTISNNMIHHNNGGGIVIGAKHVSVTGNVIWDNGTGANQAPAILNNYQSSVLNASYSVFSGNIARQITGTNQTYGYQDGGGAGTTNGIRFSGNNFTGNATAPYFLAATSTDYIFDDPLRFAESWNPAPILAGGSTSLAITTAGVIPGDFVERSLTTMPNAGLILTVDCYTANAVTATLFNSSAGTVDVPAGTLYLKVEKRPF